MHWAASYIGAPYSEDPRPGAFNCWTLLMHVQREHYDRDVPLIDPENFGARALVRSFRDHPELRRWRPLGDGETVPDGAAVLMSHSRAPHHCGVWLDVDGGRVLHAERGAGVIAQTFATLRSRGWGAFKVFDYVG